MFASDYKELISMQYIRSFYSSIIISGWIFSSGQFLASSALHAATSSAPGAVPGTHGLALGAPVKYGPDFKFEWPNLKAPKGGRLTLGGAGTFDSLNPFALKNTSDSLIDPQVRLNMVFELLAFDSMEEPFAVYGLIAQSMAVAADGLSMTFYLNPKAKFSDGKPVTAEDVAFSFKILTSDKALPGTRSYYADVKSATVINRGEIRFDFKTKNRELPLILAQLSILPKHVYGTGKDFIKGFVKTKPVGSGPYIVKSFDFGKQLVYERNKDWWGADQESAKGKWNYDEIHVKYYKDPSAAMEAFKAGDYDVRFENSSRAWAVDHVGERWDLGWIRKETWTHDRNGGGQGFFMNVRRPIFQNRLVRKALAIAFDFNWANETLFYNQYTQSSSYFNNSEFNAKGLPEGAELALLMPLKDKLPPEVFTEPKDVLGKGLTGKQRLGEAMKLFKQAGWEVKDGKLTNKDGKIFEFTFLENDGPMQRVIDPYVQSLAKIGVTAHVKLEDSANFTKRIEQHDFDIFSAPIGQSESPGNEQRDYWHSMSANKSESRNYGGLADPAVDSLVETVINAQNREDLVTATRALDRALWFTYLTIPHWYMAADRVSTWNQIQVPTMKPTRSVPSHFTIQYGWYDPAKAEALKIAMKNKTKL
ncbi:MAG: extracellular solute-binding protein [Proteobacteria bacterium]|nr:extracellular solute-binding protein [Pseudomonadota bacterium]